MGILDSIWEEVEDFGSTAYEGIKDAGSSLNRIYEDDFLKVLEQQGHQIVEDTENYMKHDDNYRDAAKMALQYWATGGEGFDGTNSLETFFGPENFEYFKQGQDAYDNFSGGSSPGQGSSQADGQSQRYLSGPASLRGSSYDDLIRRLNRMIRRKEQEIDPLAELLTQSGTGY